VPADGDDLPGGGHLLCGAPWRHSLPGDRCQRQCGELGSVSRLTLEAGE
jgi:hypothetical protein